MKLIAIALVALVLSFSSGEYDGNSEPIVTTPPSKLKLDSFYMKYIDANGFPIVSSSKVPDKALLKARETVIMMTEFLPANVLDTMLARGVRVTVMARYEGTTDIPEYKFLEADTTINWDLRARGLGGVPHLPLTSCAEENLLCYQIDKYHAEDILIHEFAHTIHLVGFVLNDPGINDKLWAMLNKATAEGKWENTYAATNQEEYWAEGVQTWFNANADVPVSDGKHNQINTREELKIYDRDLYDFLSQYFSESDSSCSCHSGS